MGGLLVQVMYGSEEVSRLPVVLAPGLLVARASSMWVTAKLPGGAVVWWDGRSRAHIDLPQGYRGAVQVPRTIQTVMEEQTSTLDELVVSEL